MFNLVNVNETVLGVEALKVIQKISILCDMVLWLHCKSISWFPIH